jgi:hypothetical protein
MQAVRFLQNWQSHLRAPGICADTSRDKDVMALASIFVVGRWPDRQLAAVVGAQRGPYL